jgi:hypothetical protein
MKTNSGEELAMTVIDTKSNALWELTTYAHVRMQYGEEARNRS